MADNAREDQANRPTDEAQLSARLRRLGDQLGRERSRDLPETDRGQPGAEAGGAAGLARGLRLSSELVAGALVGAAIGWALDRLIGTSPLGLIVFLLLGFAAGVFNLIRTAGAAPGTGHGQRDMTCKGRRNE
jgi:ATP synthase protein I